MIEAVSVIIQVIILDGIFSLDNAAVLGSMVSVLPLADRVPWPPALSFLTGGIQRIFGGQRSAALKIGLLGAYAARGMMLFFATVVVQNPWIKLVGAIYLIKIGCDFLGKPDEGKGCDEAAYVDRAAGKSFWGVVLMVEMADLAFSVDNVVAIVALTNSMLLIMSGIVVSILMMRFAAGVFCWLIDKEPVLRPATYVLVFIIGLEVLLSSMGIMEFPPMVKFTISIMTLGLALLYAHSRPLHVLRPILVWISQGMGVASDAFSWVMMPLGAVAKAPGRLMQLLHGVFS
jgi:tellurite resistance protein TerC